MPILTEIENFIERERLSASRFGRLAAHDPRLVDDLRKGRKLRPTTEAKLKAYLTRGHVAVGC